ncbi:MAG TPA: hypothetical protein VKD90_23260 [Gemmataceae bacterium]|nr:hypothetical protein [Gemmataceae bacterium]
MSIRISAQAALAVGAVLIAASPAAAQNYPPNGWYRTEPLTGYSVRRFGYYDSVVLPPGPGGYGAYYIGRPFVTTIDPWGVIAEVPLRPKVLYYSDRILTPYGSYYPVSISVIPDNRPAVGRVEPAAPLESRPVELPTFRYDPGTPVKTAPERLMPRATDPDARPAPAAPRLPDLPPIPKAPVPGTGDGPKLGPSPK